MTTTELIDCPCGKTGLHPRGMRFHKQSEQHKRWEFYDLGSSIETTSPAEVMEGPGVNGSLPTDLQAAVDAVYDSPQLRAKMVRYAFAYRGWPNKEHQGTVREFLQEQSIPIAEPLR